LPGAMAITIVLHLKVLFIHSIQKITSEARYSFGKRTAFLFWIFDLFFAKFIRLVITKTRFNADFKNANTLGTKPKSIILYYTRLRRATAGRMQICGYMQQNPSNHLKQIYKLHNRIDITCG
jgi:hypothetical protein